MLAGLNTVNRVKWDPGRHRIAGSDLLTTDDLMMLMFLLLPCIFHASSVQATHPITGSIRRGWV
jgi:hypothetical protein